MDMLAQARWVMYVRGTCMHTVATGAYTCRLVLQLDIG